MVLRLVLLLLALLLSPTGEAAKIIGGHEAKPHSSPYMAYLQIQTADKILICGGFLVREDFVLTAAHCQGSLCRSINVTLGAHNIMDREKSQQVIPVRRAIPHPRYNDKTFSNDIMLLQEGDYDHCCEPHQSAQGLGYGEPRDAMQCGWGLLGVDMPRPDKLQEVELEVQRAEECTYRYSYYSTTTQICAGDPRESKSFFKGDSGGPLVCNGVAQGIVSFGKKDGTTPHVYTRISSFMSWIQTTMTEYKWQGSD